MRGKDLLIIIIGSLFFAFFLSVFYPEHKLTVTIISPLADNISGLKTLLNQEGDLKEVVNKSLENTKGTYGIVIKNLRTGEAYTAEGDRLFEPASLYKLWVMGTAYRQLKSGVLVRSEILSDEIQDLNKTFDIDEEFAERTEGTVTLRADNAIERMITFSDNYAALLLVSKLKSSNVSAFMRDQGFTKSKLGQPPQTTPLEIALFYEKLYAGSVVDGESSREMIEILSRQELNDRIPKYLPDGTEVAHKTGELGVFKHDAGIIFGRDPILFVALSETNSPSGAAERIAELSRDVFNYFENK